MGQVEIARDAQNKPTLIDYDDKWSMRDFTNQKHIFQGVGKALDGITIYATCFYQEELDVDVFPSDVKNLTLVHCNIDNVNVPTGVTVIENRPKKRIQVQNDLRDWEIDDSDVPTKVLNEKYWTAQGISVNPADIPVTKLKSIDDLVSKFDYLKVLEDLAPSATVDEKAILASLLTQSDIAAQDKDLKQFVADQLDKLTALQVRLESGS